MGRALDMLMEKLSVEETVKKTLEEISRRPLREILAYMVKGENDAISLYAFLHEKLPEGYPKATFERFMMVEAEHSRKVKQVFRSLFPGEEVPEVPFKSWGEILVEKDFRLRSVGDYLGVLRVAMDAEQLSEAVYTMLAEMLDEAEHKRIMRELAGDEREHYKLLKEEYELYFEFEARKALDELIRELKKGT
ncbi:ferritin family protein [Thermococcus atlanticus]